MLSNKTLVHKRARKAAKRAKKNLAAKKGKVSNEKYVKRHNLRVRAMQIILQNPSLRKKFYENQAKIQESKQANVESQVRVPVQTS